MILIKKDWFLFWDFIGFRFLIVIRNFISFKIRLSISEVWFLICVRLEKKYKRVLRVLII